MAANDKITPTALLIANNLKGTKYSTKSTYKLTSKTTSKYKNVYTDAVEFLASLYAKEVKVADFNALWNFRNVDESPNTAPYTPNKNFNYDLVGQVVAFSELEWNELQIAISKAFNVIYPFDLASLAGVYTPTEEAYYLSQMGVFGSAPGPKMLVDCEGNPLSGPWNQDASPSGYANKWNEQRVPADAALGVDTFFIAPIFKPASGTNNYYRFTGKRRWNANPTAPFEGYDIWADTTPSANYRITETSDIRITESGDSRIVE
jgi:hypothetical protein